MAKRLATMIIALTFVACGSAAATQSTPASESRSDLHLTSGDGPDAVQADRGGSASFATFGDSSGPNLAP